MTGTMSASTTRVRTASEPLTPILKTQRKARFHFHISIKSLLLPSLRMHTSRSMPPSTVRMSRMRPEEVVRYTRLLRELIRGRVEVQSSARRSYRAVVMPTEALFALGMLKLTSLMLTPTLRPLPQSIDGSLRAWRMRLADFPPRGGACRAVHTWTDHRSFCRRAPLRRTGKLFDRQVCVQLACHGSLHSVRAAARRPGDVRSLTPSPLSWPRTDKGGLVAAVSSQLSVKKARPRPRATLAARLVLAGCAGAGSAGSAAGAAGAGEGEIAQ